MARQQKYQRQGNRQSKRKRQLRQRMMLTVICAAVLAGAGGYLVLRHKVSQTDRDRICGNVFIGTQNVSGMTEEEAQEALLDHLSRDSTAAVTLEAGKHSVTVSLKELGIDIRNAESLTQKAADYVKTGSVLSRYREQKNLEKEKYVVRERFCLDPDTAEAVLTQKAAPLIRGARDASIEKEGSSLRITPEKEGKKLDTEKTIRAVEDYLNDSWDHKNFSIQIKTKKDKPSVTGKDLSTIKDELGSFWTDAGGGDRWNNLATGVEKLNGTILMPGETLSVGQTTGPYTAENGYVEAGAYENGQVVPDYGGGICQVSTTLYNAVIYAELEVVERSPHSMTVAYVKPSRDAAIAGDYLDFRFRNNYDTPVYIFGEIDQQNHLQFAIYGRDTRDKDRKVEYESETLSTDPGKTVYRENSKLPAGTTQVSGSLHDGLEACLWKIVYEKGKEVSREVFNTSHYEKSDQVIEVGTASEDPAVTAAVQAAVSSQDPDQIYAVIGGLPGAAGQ